MTTLLLLITALLAVAAWAQHHIDQRHIAARDAEIAGLETEIEILCDLVWEQAAEIEQLRAARRVPWTMWVSNSIDVIDEIDWN